MDRMRRWFLRYVSLLDVVELSTLLIAIALTWITLETQYAVFGAILGTLYIVFVVVKFYLTITSRRAKDALQGEVLWGLFDLLNREIFSHENRTRFTLFLCDKIDRRRIIPWYRYVKGGSDAISEAENSNVAYRKGEGVTGRAWQQAGESELSLLLFPPFANKQELIAHYTTDLEVADTTAASISDYMIQVGAIFSIGYTDTRGKFLGVLSIDIQMPLFLTEDDEALMFTGGDGSDIEIGTDHLLFIAESIRNVLRSFQV